MRKVILFVLGQTLVDYFSRARFRVLMKEGIAAAAEVLRREGWPVVEGDELRRRVKAEDSEHGDWCVRPLEERLGHIFGFDPVVSPEPTRRACGAFTDCLIAPGRLYDDTLPVLEDLRARGHRMGIVSNMPWGTPAEPWVEDLERRGIAPYMEHILFCRDVGWRKPDRRIFEEALRRFRRSSGDCLFIGDRPDWDIQGAQEAGMEAILLDRDLNHPEHQPRIESLRDLARLL